MGCFCGLPDLSSPKDSSRCFDIRAARLLPVVISKGIVNSALTALTFVAESSLSCDDEVEDENDDNDDVLLRW